MVVVKKKKGETQDQMFRRFTRIFRDENVTWFAKQNENFLSKPKRRIEKSKEKARRIAQMRRRSSY